MTDKIEVMARAMFPWVNLPPEGPHNLPHKIDWKGDKATQATAAEKAMCRDIAKAALEALEAQGLVVVPMEPTKAMLDAAGWDFGSIPVWWQAMLAAVEGKE